MNRLLRATAAVALLAVPAVTLPAAHAQVAEPCPIVVGHRADEGPENTVAGIQLTAATGVPMVEVDVRYTASGYPYLLHDETLDRTTTGTGPIQKVCLRCTSAKGSRSARSPVSARPASAACTFHPYV